MDKNSENIDNNNTVVEPIPTKINTYRNIILTILFVTLSIGAVVAYYMYFVYKAVFSKFM